MKWPAREPRRRTFFVDQRLDALCFLVLLVICLCRAPSNRVYFREPRCGVTVAAFDERGEEVALNFALRKHRRSNRPAAVIPVHSRERGITSTKRRILRLWNHGQLDDLIPEGGHLVWTLTHLQKHQEKTADQFETKDRTTLR